RAVRWAMPSLFLSAAPFLGGLANRGGARNGKGGPFADCAFTFSPSRTRRARARPPLDPQPDSPLDGVQMRILSARGDEPELWLNPVEELVQHQDPSCASIQGRRKVPDVSGPSRATPLERRIAEPKRSRPFPCRARLVRGERSR